MLNKQRKQKLRRKRRQLRKQIKRNINKLSIDIKSMELPTNLMVLEYTSPSVLDLLCGNRQKYIKDMEMWKQKRRESLYGR